LAARSIRSTHRIVEGSGHVIHDDRPAALLEAIHQLIRG
jgi:pimeloyl-ACP methyl ester carboxylesterase